VEPGMWLQPGNESERDGVTPESLDAERRDLADLARDFVARRVLPEMPALESPDFALHRRLLSEAGDLGLLGLLVPHSHDGGAQGLLATALVMQHLAVGGGIGVSAVAHSGIGTLPLVLFGGQAQRDRYLPRLASGRWIGAFAMTEPGAGSDAMSVRTTATPCPGGWRLCGDKQFITNAGIADIFTVVARVGDGGLATFLVERAADGLSLGPEDIKMGLHGSSTRRVRFDGVFVPQRCLLGRLGRGQVVAFTVMALGRYIMCGGCLGLANRALALAAGYARERRQFGRPIASMGLIREKVAAMAVRIFALESALYRLGGWLDAAGGDVGAFGPECSALKVFASETSGFCADEALQVHGGSGYMRASEVERLYRDVRVQRIFEGTSEINRLIAARRVLRVARHSEVFAADLAATSGSATPADPGRVCTAVKRAVLGLAALVGSHSGGTGDGQEAMARVADVAIAAFVADAALERARQTDSAANSDLAALAVHLARGIALTSAWEVYGAHLPPERAVAAHGALAAAIPVPLVDVIAVRARVAARLVGEPAAGADAAVLSLTGQSRDGA